MTSHEAAYAYIMSHMSAAVPRPYSQGRVCSRCGAFFGRGEWGECKARREAVEGRSCACGAWQPNYDRVRGGVAWR